MSAEKIDTRWAKLPPPSRALFESMALAGYEANVAIGFIRDRDTGTETRDPWEQCGEELRDAFMAEARAMYAEVAKAGGARIEVIMEPQP